MDVGNADRLNLAEFTIGDHLASLPYEWITGVVVRDGEDDTGLVDDVGKLLGLGKVECERLVADDVEAGFRGGFGDFEVSVVRRCDRDKVDSLAGRKSFFAFEQFLI